ncbi:hypothetical protein [Pseudolysinimonas sp.]|jgi:hypothetical protein|uniref:hypothetical protein n=1 Tax=Pseudolysinimonas sp. TaxID=2680009 RepID=UPI003783832C
MKKSTLRVAMAGAFVASVLSLAGCSLVGDVAPSPTPPSSDDGTPDLANMTSDELAQWQLDSYWEMVASQHPGAIRPEIEVVRYIDLPESATVLAGCMVDSGWPDVRATPDNGVESGTIPAGQEEAYDLAMYVCHASYPLDLKYIRPLTEEQKSALYAYLRDELAPCLEAEGFNVSDAPSEQAFLESYDETGGWDIYASVVSAGLSQEAWYEINEVCPQVPSDLYE